MKVLVCGSRDWADEAAVRRRIADLPMGTTVITGGAKGADHMASEAAEECGLNESIFVADWKGEGKRAGILRNLAMLDEGPQLVIAFLRNGSPGTSHTVKEANKRGIPVELHEATA